MRFGVQMAERGLWSEAWFRFDQARSLGAGNDPQVLNNLAVASEALGRFDEALELYRQALVAAPGNADLKNNYDRFVGFYEAFRAQADAEGTAPAAVPGATPAEPGADYGSGAAPAAPGPLAPGGVATSPPPIPLAEPPGQPAPQPTDSDEPPPDDPDGGNGDTHHG
jgi:hypothetical protein